MFHKYSCFINIRLPDIGPETCWLFIGVAQRRMLTREYVIILFKHKVNDYINAVSEMMKLMLP